MSSRLAKSTLLPMLASIGTELPTGAWTYEPKYDGIRVLAFVTPKTVALMTRNHKDKAAQFPEIVGALRTFAIRVKRPMVLDGEIVALDGKEPARFQVLQQRMHVQDQAEIARHQTDTPTALMLFDMLLDGNDVLLKEPWHVRRAHLERRVGRYLSPVVRLGASTSNDGAGVLRKARASGWEGVIAKQVDSTYEPGVRSPAWQKLKVEFRQEFVVGGYTEPRNTREYIGALLLGYFSHGRLTYVGHMGGGFTRRGLAEMYDRLAPLERKRSPFTITPHTNERAHWVRPEVVVEVKFSEWTNDGRLRQPIFLGIRDDKAAREVGKEGVSIH